MEPLKLLKFIHLPKTQSANQLSFNEILRFQRQETCFGGGDHSLAQQLLTVFRQALKEAWRCRGFFFSMFFRVFSVVPKHRTVADGIYIYFSFCIFLLCPFLKLRRCQFFYRQATMANTQLRGFKRKTRKIEAKTILILSSNGTCCL